MAKIDYQIITPAQAKYTAVLENLGDPPERLYVRGKLPVSSPDRPKTVAIVGSRHNTRYGEEVAYRLAYELARHNVIVVSGLAYGIDSIGHKGCLDAGGTTIAVLGNPIDHIHPTSHAKFANEILKKGAIVSEYPPASMPLADAPLAPGEHLNEQGRRMIEYSVSFLHRNRLISGLADAVVVVEAAEKSGSLNTATHALAQGKEVFAVPGNITSPYSQGCNKLIRQGACPYTEPSDVLNLLFPEAAAKSRKKLRAENLIGDTDVETAILKALASGCRTGSSILTEAKLPPEIFGQFITILEIKGRVRSLGANNWALV